MSKKLVYGVGLYEKGEYAAKVEGKHTKEYSLWLNMLQRCYSEVCQQRYPTYIGCSISQEFKYFQKFAEWCGNQIGLVVRVIKF